MYEMTSTDLVFKHFHKTLYQLHSMNHLIQTVSPADRHVYLIKSDCKYVIFHIADVERHNVRLSFFAGIKAT